MSTYIIGDIHGCFTQFTELRERIEAKGPNARFILVGDIVARGPEDEKMLDWAYKNITLDGKYQMVLGNHDDTFIEIFGNGEFETIYSIGKKVGNHVNVPDDEFKHLEKDKELMYKYAEFMSKQPLVKKIEVNGQKFVIAHAWYMPDEMEKKNAFQQRYCLLWERDRDDYDGKILLKYKPVESEKLIHGHSPTLGKKVTIHRGYSPGKIWDMGTSVNIDCGLVYNITKRNVVGFEYGNLAAYNLETGEAEYLFDIADEYANNSDEYYEDKKERKERERLEHERKRQEAVEKAMPYLLSFYKQVYNLDAVPAENDSEYRSDFNFLNDSMRFYIKTRREYSDNYDFDFGNETVFAVTGKYGKEKFYLYSGKQWLDVDLVNNSKYKVFKYDDRYYLLGANDYNEKFAEITVYVFDYPRVGQLLYYKTITPGFRSTYSDSLMANDVKMDKNKRGYYRENDDKEEPNGLMTCDFYDRGELFTVKILKNMGDHFFVRILDSQKNVLSEIRQSYYK